jgi:hypothetical protein
MLKKFKIHFIALFCFVCVILFVCVVNKSDPANNDVRDINWSGHNVNPNITPLPSKNGWPRFSEFDPMSQRSIQNGGNTDVQINITSSDYNEVFNQQELIYLAKYTAAEKTFNDQFIHLPIPTPSSSSILQILNTRLNGNFEVIYAADSDNPSNFSNLVFDPNKSAQAISIKYNNAILLKLGNDIAHAIASVNQTGDGWMLNHIIPIELTGSATSVPILSYKKFVNNLQNGSYFMYWRSYSDVPAYLYAELGPDSVLILDSIHPAYIVQSDALIPAYLICGYQADDDTKQKYEACGVAEAVDYGDY